MLNNLTNFLNLIAKDRIKKKLELSDIIAIGTKQSSKLGDYKPTAIVYADLEAQLLASVPTPTPLPTPSVGASIWANKFTPVGCISEDITLPTPGAFTYPSPLSICVGGSVTVPVGTTLTVV
jgi:hypothetical protein